MRLILFHPGISRIDCRDCVKRLYDFETGLPKVFESGPNREKNFITAEKNGHKPPCRLGKSCPKGSPEESHLHTLSPRNHRTFALYLQRKATGFASMSEREKNDEIVANNFAILDGLWREYERQRSEESSTVAFSQVMQMMTKRG